MINAAVCGLGRAGAELVRTIADRNDMRIRAAFCSKGSEKKGRDIGLLAHIQEMGIKAQEVTDAESVLGGGRIDVVIDFSNPEASKILLAACGKYGVPIVVCTTGFSDDELKWMKRLARDKSFGLVYAPNVTLGINVLISVLKNVAQALPFFDYRITETHHSKKTDIPSGTAKKISDVLENELQLDGENPVPINSVRAGGYVGIHEVIAVGEFERLTIAHESFSRRAFADGALHAAKFVRNKKGWFEMSDIISEHPLVKMTAPDKRIARLLPNTQQQEHNV